MRSETRADGREVSTARPPIVDHLRHIRRHIAGSKQPFLFINFKLSSEVCAAAYDEGKEVNELTWNLVLPFINGLDASELPESGFDWLDQGEIHIAHESPELFECLLELIQLDQ